MKTDLATMSTPPSQKASARIEVLQRVVAEHKTAKSRIHPSPKVPLGEQVGPLKLEYSKDGMLYRQIERTPQAVLFGVFKQRQDEEGKESLHLRGYEVVIPIIAKPFSPRSGCSYGWRKTYPSAERFGDKAFYYGPEDNNGWALSKSLSINRDSLAPCDECAGQEA
jgi:hypothetical protein